MPVQAFSNGIDRVSDRIKIKAAGKSQRTDHNHILTKPINDSIIVTLFQTHQIRFRENQPITLLPSLSHSSGLRYVMMNHVGSSCANRAHSSDLVG